MPETESSFDNDAGPLARWWDDLVVATAFLTRLPLRLDSRRASRSLAGTARAFPLVGLVVGLGATAVYAAAHGLGLPPLPAALLAVGTMVMLTGGLHEDGLADVADGLGGGLTREDKLRIMRDSRSGAYGVLAIVFSVGMRGAAVGALADPALVAGAVLAAAAVSRAAMPQVMVRLDPARADGLGAGAGRPAAADAHIGAALAVVLALLLLPFGAAVWGVVTAAVAVAALAALAKSRIGGYTGDVLGAVQQTAEAAMLLAVAAATA